MISDEELIYIAKDQKTYLNTFADGPILRFGRALEAVVSLRYDEMIAELERENQMMRARNERLEKEVKWLETALANAQIQLLNKVNESSH